MQISVIGSYTPRLTPSRTGTDADLTNFGALMQTTIKAASASTGATTSTGLSDTKPKFNSMTPSGFKAEAQAMYDRGEIDLTTLGVMQVAGNTENPDGSAGTAPTDFISKIKSMMAFEKQSGRSSSSSSPYDIYENILSKITPRSGANLVG